MKLIVPVALALIVAAPLAVAKDKKKKDLVPAVFNNARYVYVEAEDGDIMNPRLFPEDREAIVDVEDQLKDWNRYAVTLNQSDADLVMVIRRGRLVSLQGHGGVGIGSNPGLGSVSGRRSGCQATVQATVRATGIRRSRSEGRRLDRNWRKGGGWPTLTIWCVSPCVNPDKRRGRNHLAARDEGRIGSACSCF